jgi:RNA polymerase sigma factor (sigma-70 family)
VDDEPAPRPTSARITEALVANHRAFLAFLEQRVGSREVAEDILQDAFVKSVERGESLREDESAVAWFYRMLRNAVVDHHRRKAATSRKLDAFADELAAQAPTTPEVRNAVCQCVARLADTLPEDYARALTRIEIDGIAVKDYAEEAGITSNNAAVRVFRAREALRKSVARSCGTCADHGCLDCTCRPKPTDIAK